MSSGKCLILFSFLMALAPLDARTKKVKALAPLNACHKRTEASKANIKKSFDQLWESVDSSVGVEFFMLVLKSNNRMPSSDQGQASFYGQLLKGMKKTSSELSDHGTKFDSKKVKKLESMIQELAQLENCKVIVSR